VINPKTKMTVLLINRLYPKLSFLKGFNTCTNFSGSANILLRTKAPLFLP
jgi:hypothetical protein